MSTLATNFGATIRIHNFPVQLETRRGDSASTIVAFAIEQVAVEIQFTSPCLAVGVIAPVLSWNRGGSPTGTAPLPLGKRTFTLE